MKFDEVPQNLSGGQLTLKYLKKAYYQIHKEFEMVFDFHGYKHWVETHEDRLLLAGGLISLPLLVLLFFGCVYRDNEC